MLLFLFSFLQYFAVVHLSKLVAIKMNLMTSVVARESNVIRDHNQYTKKRTFTELSGLHIVFCLGILKAICGKSTTSFLFLELKSIVLQKKR